MSPLVKSYLLALALTLLAFVESSNASDDLRHGFVIRESVQLRGFPRPVNYSLYMPDSHAVKLVPLVVFLQDVWTSAKDDDDLFRVADVHAAQHHPFALLRPEGNWLLADVAPWNTADFPSFWASSPLFGDSREMVRQLILKVKLARRVKGPVAIVGHGVGGWGARAIAAEHPGEFAAVGSLSGVTGADCLMRMIAATRDCQGREGVFNRLQRFEDLAAKAEMVLGGGEWNDGKNKKGKEENKKKINLPTPGEVLKKFAFDERAGKPLVVDPTLLESWRRFDVHEEKKGFRGGLLYLEVETDDEYGLYSCNVMLHDMLLEADVPHVYKARSTGDNCSSCRAQPRSCLRECARYPDTKACGGHRPDGPLGLESSLRDADGRPLWTGSLKSSFEGFLELALPVIAA